MAETKSQENQSAKNHRPVADHNHSFSPYDAWSNAQENDQDQSPCGSRAIVNG
jgi:hypothetical protein